MTGPSRRALLRLRLDALLGTPPGDAVAQRPARPSGAPLPGCSAERGHDEAPPPWLRPRREYDHD